MSASLLTALGITPEHLTALSLTEYVEATNLVSAGVDIYNRNVLMTQETLDAWQPMQQAAAQDQVIIQLVSAFRSVTYQYELIRKKLDSGRRLEDILKVNTPPGFSEHHTGRALDLTTPGCKPLETELEETAAFDWLSAHARQFNFELSYPRNNEHGITYEPWHWCYTPMCNV